MARYCNLCGCRYNAPLIGKAEHDPVACAMAQQMPRRFGGGFSRERFPSEIDVKPDAHGAKTLDSVADSLKRLAERQAPLLQDGCDTNAQEPIADVVWYHGDPPFEWVLRFDDPKRETTIYLHNSGHMAVVKGGTSGS